MAKWVASQTQMNVNNVMSEYKGHTPGDEVEVEEDIKYMESYEQVPFDTSPYKQNEILEDSDEEIEEVDQYELNKQLDK